MLCQADEDFRDFDLNKSAVRSLRDKTVKHAFRAFAD